MLQHYLSYSSTLSLFIFITGLLLWACFKKKYLINLVPPLMLVIMVLWLFTIQASNDRNWRAEVSILPKIKINNNIANIQNLRNVSWQNTSPVMKWEDRNYDLTKLNSLDLIIEPFNNSKLMAHAMLDFGFEDQGHVIVSVEARKEINEEYNLLAGALRQFELIYVFGDEKDLLTLRAVHRGSKLYLYPIKADPEFMVALFEDLANSANALHETPQFYRTLRDNCTTTLVEHIDRQYQQKIGLQIETVFPAKAGELLYKLDRMDTDLPYPMAHQASRIDQLVVKYQDEVEHFSSLVHTGSNLAYGKR